MSSKKKLESSALRNFGAAKADFLLPCFSVHSFRFKKQATGPKRVMWFASGVSGLVACFRAVANIGSRFTPAAVGLHHGIDHGTLLLYAMVRVPSARFTFRAYHLDATREPSFLESETTHERTSSSVPILLRVTGAAYNSLFGKPTMLNAPAYLSFG